ncbi:MAG: hypothetical protein AAB573_00625 [Patescibacteria group bacterium]
MFKKDAFPLRSQYKSVSEEIRNDAMSELGRDLGSISLALAAFLFALAIPASAITLPIAVALIGLTVVAVGMAVALPFDKPRQSRAQLSIR